jgi:hypothetical protein
MQEPQILQSKKGKQMKIRALLTRPIRIAAVLLVVMIAAATGSVFALNSNLSSLYYLSYGLSSPSTTFGVMTSNSSVWSSYVDNARSSWGAAGVTINRNDTVVVTNKMYIQAYSDDWYGVNAPTLNSSGYIASYTIRINNRTLSDAAGPQNLPNYARSTIAHELGHCFWLRDNPVTSSTSLMAHSRNRATVYAPQSFDISKVQYVYN